MKFKPGVCGASRHPSSKNADAKIHRLLGLQTALLICFAAIPGAEAGAADFPALSLSAGGGGAAGYTFTRYVLEAGMENGGAIQSAQTMDRFDYGGFLFCDITYGELSVLFQGGNSGYGETMEAKAGNSWGTVSNGAGAGAEMSLGFSLLGKYPFQIAGKMRLFPLLGLEYRFALLEWRRPEGGITYDRTEGRLPEDRDKDGSAYSLSAWNSLRIAVGAGLDYALAGPWYVRGELLFGFRLPTGYENGVLEMTKRQFGAPDPKLTGLTGGPAFKFALGYHFLQRTGGAGRGIPATEAE
jgi:hypothetical protein